MSIASTIIPTIRKYFFLNKLKIIKLVFKKKNLSITILQYYFYIAWNIKRIIIDPILKIDIHLFIEYFNLYIV